MHAAASATFSAVSGTPVVCDEVSVIVTVTLFCLSIVIP
jgi:hypothetical protein